MKMTTINHTENCIELCNKMLRGERSAVETYTTAIDKFDKHPGLTGLLKIRDEHRLSVNELEEQIRTMGGTPDKNSGTWGTFANLIQSAANLFGEESAVEALKKGEEKGLNDYQDALAGDCLLPTSRKLYVTALIPRIREHIAALDRIEDQLD